MCAESASEMPELRVLKGTADQPPERQMRRQRVMNVVRETFERFGYNPLETPILSHFDLLALKYGPGDPILDEIFHATDRGKRELGLRYDLTVPFCRFVGMQLQGHFSLPFKRYEIGKVFRDGPIKEGRLREFTQCDADIVGANDFAFDAECMATAGPVFAALGIDAEIELNNRKALWAIMEEAGLAETHRDAATMAVDKWDKVPREEVVRELGELGLSPSQIERIFSLLEIEGGNDAILAALERALQSELGREGLAEIRAVLEACADLKVRIPIRVSPRLARGLGIYTGTIFEFFCRDRSIVSSSLGSGGRYDRIVGEFLHPGEPEKQWDYPCVGVSFGVEPIAVALEKIESGAAERKTVADAWIVPMGTRRQALGLAADLRGAGVRTEVDLSGSRLKKTFKRADQMGVPFLLILGEDEMAAGEVALRDMKSGEQTRLKLREAAGALAARLSE
ncbi:MAG: Histidine--tRNA ligase [candidate division BRC1 bacterium ADurb.BinA364]|nr:MAG: Histidine--tRNA ligase [candidate division BRC1 bacterium ADurb.BinA364]